MPSCVPFSSPRIHFFNVCGRLTLRSNPAGWIQDFLPQWTSSEIASCPVFEAAKPRFNIAPTQLLFGIHAADKDLGRRQCEPFRWGLLPSWASDSGANGPLINARSETVDQKRSFCDSFKHRRCLIPADGYYEWQSSGGGKQPYFIEAVDGRVLAMAGLWAENETVAPSATGSPGTTCTTAVRSCTVLTTNANETTKSIHDRMPVFLSADAQQAWLDPSSSRDVLMDLLRPAGNELLAVRKVSSLVNHVRNDDARCVERYEPPTQMSLF